MDLEKASWEMRLRKGKDEVVRCRELVELQVWVQVKRFEVEGRESMGMTRIVEMPNLGLEILKTCELNCSW